MPALLNNRSTRPNPRRLVEQAADRRLPLTSATTANIPPALAHTAARAAWAAGDDDAPPRPPESQCDRTAYPASASRHHGYTVHEPALCELRWTTNASATPMNGSSTTTSALRTIRAPDSSAPNR